MNRFEYVSPQRVTEAVDLLRGKGAIQAKAGGTDLVGLMKDRVASPERVVNLKGLGLKTIEVKGAARIGAMVTLDEVARSPQLHQGFTALAVSAAESATPQIRNMATVGGSLCQSSRCWYFRNEAFDCRRRGGKVCPALEGENRHHALFENTDCCSVHPSSLGTALVCLDGALDIAGPEGSRTVSSDQFFDTGKDSSRDHSLKKGELITGITISSGWKSVYMEVRERQSFDWPLVSIARAERNGVVRTVFGGVASRPWLVKEDDIFAGIRTLSRNGYKKKLMSTLFERASEALR